MIKKIMGKIRGVLRSEIDRGGSVTHDRMDVEFARIDGHGSPGRVLHGTLLAELRRGRDVPRLADAGFRVFSQFGEDGIFQYLIERLPGIPTSFVEIGTEDYSESNTRFLLQKDDWRGLLVDGSDAALRFLEREGLRWRHAVEHVAAWVDRDNANALLAPMAGEIGILSIDVDGNDLWIWERLEVVRPWIVAIEFQPLFGPVAAVASPYRPDFDRYRHHASGAGSGASLAALTEAGRRKGYDFVGTNGAHNAFFVRSDVRPPSLPVRTAEEEWREPRHRDVRSPSGEPIYPATHAERVALIADAVVVDLRTGEERPFGSLVQA